MYQSCCYSFHVFIHGLFSIFLQFIEKKDFFPKKIGKSIHFIVLPKNRIEPNVNNNL